MSEKEPPPDPAFQTAELDERFRNLEGKAPIVPTGKTMDVALHELHELLESATDTLAGAAMECHAISMLLMTHRGAFPVDARYIAHVFGVLDESEAKAKEVAKRIRALVHHRVDGKGLADDEADKAKGGES